MQEEIADTIQPVESSVYNEGFKAFAELVNILGTSTKTNDNQPIIRLVTRPSFSKKEIFREPD